MMISAAMARVREHIALGGCRLLLLGFTLKMAVCAALAYFDDDAKSPFDFARAIFSPPPRAAHGTRLAKFDATPIRGRE